MNGSTAGPTDFWLDTPNGLLPQSSFTTTTLDLSSVRVSFPPQNTIGYYEVYAGPAIEDVYGDQMAGTYVGSFVILSPILSGHVTDTNGAPVSYVTIHPGSGLLPAVTDTHGAYSLEVPPGWSGTLTPAKGSAF